MYSHWNYRVIESKTASGETFFAVYEVYYDNDGNPTSCTVEPQEPFGETYKELLTSMKHYKRAFKKPILQMDLFTKKK